MIDKQSDHFVLCGVGWRHGVGLCQIGAAVTANAARTYTEILQHYPVRGDFARGIRSLLGQPQFLPDGRNLMFELANRSKKSISVDLRRSQGQQVLYRLAQHCDALVTNLHPSALREFRVDGETLQGVNPNLIYAHATGFGPRGPHAEDPCQDTVGMARAGIMFNTPAADGSPIYLTGAPSDILSGTMLGFGVLTALLARERHGITQAVWASQLSTMMWLQYYNVAQYLNMGEDFAPYDRTKVANPLMNLYRCSDGQWIACGMAVAQRFWPEFCPVMGLAQLEQDPHFTTDENRAAHRTELVGLLDRAFATHSRDRVASRIGAENRHELAPECLRSCQGSVGAVEKLDLASL